jgi:hypothetical protein
MTVWASADAWVASLPFYHARTVYAEVIYTLSDSEDKSNWLAVSLYMSALPPSGTPTSLLPLIALAFPTKELTSTWNSSLFLFLFLIHQSDPASERAIQSSQSTNQPNHQKKTPSKFIKVSVVNLTSGHRDKNTECPFSLSRCHFQPRPISESRECL